MFTRKTHVSAAEQHTELPQRGAQRDTNVCVAESTRGSRWGACTYAGLRVSLSSGRRKGAACGRLKGPTATWPACEVSPGWPGHVLLAQAQGMGRVGRGPRAPDGTLPPDRAQVPGPLTLRRERSRRLGLRKSNRLQGEKQVSPTFVCGPCPSPARPLPTHEPDSWPQPGSLRAPPAEKPRNGHSRGAPAEAPPLPGVHTRGKCSKRSHM